MKKSFLDSYRVKEALDGVRQYHNTEKRQNKKIDMSLHSEYTNMLSMIEQFGEFAREKRLRTGQSYSRFGDKGGA